MPDAGSSFVKVDVEESAKTMFEGVSIEPFSGYPQKGQEIALSLISF